MMKILVATLAAVLGAEAQVTSEDLLRADPSNWLSYSGAYHSQRHSALRQIRTDNVRALVPKWIFHVPGATRLEAVPLVSNGVMYVSQPNEVYALDAGSGRKIWNIVLNLPSSGDQTGV